MNKQAVGLLSLSDLIVLTFLPRPKKPERVFQHEIICTPIRILFVARGVFAISFMMRTCVQQQQPCAL